MMIDTDSKEMRWILLKFLKDSLDFLADDPVNKRVSGKNFVSVWSMMNLSDEQIEKWMAPDDN